jgi:hypothetical protein
MRLLLIALIVRRIDEGELLPLYSNLIIYRVAVGMG